MNRQKMNQRNEEIIALVNKGVPKKEVAKRYDITPLQVWRIVNGKSGAKASGADN